MWYDSVLFKNPKRALCLPSSLLMLSIASTAEPLNSPESHSLRFCNGDQRTEAIYFFNSKPCLALNKECRLVRCLSSCSSVKLPSPEFFDKG